MATLVLVLLSTPGDLLTYEITTDRSDYDPGDIVQWQVYATLSQRTDPNLGVRLLNFNIDSGSGFHRFGNVEIGPAFPAAGYPWRSDGHGGSTLTDVFIGNPVHAPAEQYLRLTADDPGPVLALTGELTLNDAGFFALNPWILGENSYFTGRKGYSAYEVASVPAGIYVTPEPSTLAIAAAAAVLLLLLRILPNWARIRALWRQPTNSWTSAVIRPQPQTKTILS